MKRDTFLEYCKAFSASSNKEEIFDRFYEEDAIFEHPLKGTFYGKDEIVRFWSEGHTGIREVLHPVPENEFVEANRIAAEFVIEWHCTEDTDYLGPRKKGEVYRAGCAAFYHLRNDKIYRVRLYIQLPSEAKESSSPH